MSRRKHSITKEQDHLMHIFILAEASDVINNSRFVFFAAVAYITINTYVDYKAGELKADLTLQYIAIGLLSTLVVTSF